MVRPSASGAGEMRTFRAFGGMGGAVDVLRGDPGTAGGLGAVDSVTGWD